MEKVEHTGKREQLQAFILQLTRNNLIFNQQKKYKHEKFIINVHDGRHVVSDIVFE